jgi:hypothetical protein
VLQAKDQIQHARTDIHLQNSELTGNASHALALPHQSCELLDKHLSSRGPRPGFALIPAHPKGISSGAQAGIPVPPSDIRINELDPGFRRGDEWETLTVMIFTDSPRG